MQCAYHPDREPIGACVSCGRLICIECKALLGGKIYCTPCADKIFVQDRAEPAKVERAEPTTRQQPATTAQPATSTPEVVIRVESPAAAKPEPSARAINDSGQGSASVLPPRTQRVELGWLRPDLDMGNWQSSVAGFYRLCSRFHLGNRAGH